MRVEDAFAMRLRQQKTLLGNLQSTCFSVCAQKWDVGFLSYDEGLCVRNCFTKFGNWYPTLEMNLEDAPVVDYHALLQEAKGKK